MSAVARRSQVQVECPGCGRWRWISPERATRIGRGVATGRCRSCKQSPVEALSAALPEADFSDADVRWWIQQFGGEIGPREVPSVWVRAHGMPPELSALVASIAPSAT